MKAPDKIFLHPNYKGDVGASWLYFSITNKDVCYIRKDTLLEWAIEMKRICKGAEPIEKAYQTVIDKIESL